MMHFHSRDNPFLGIMKEVLGFVSKTAPKEMKGKCRVGLTDKMTVFPMLLE